MSSAGSSLRSSPYGSNSDLNDEEIYTDKPMRKSRNNRAGGYDYDDVEQTIYKAQQDAGEFTQDYQAFRSTNQGHTRRIHEMMSQFDDARIRIDRLLQRSSSSRDYLNDFRYSPVVMQRSSIDIGRVGNSRSGESSPKMMHKSELMVNPTVPNKTPIFEAVSLTVRVDEEQAAER